MNSKEDDVKAQEIKQAQDKLEQEADDLNKEMETEFRDSKRAEATSQREKERIARQGMITPGGLEAFKKSLLSALKLQVVSNREADDSWNALNQRYDGTGILQPGRITHEVEKTVVPVVNFYFDYSGSWNEDKIRMGKKVVAMMAKMEQDKEILLNLYAFHNGYIQPIDNMDALTRGSGGTDCWDAIVREVVASGATNVIIMTDDDMEKILQYHNSGHASAKVKGYVWYLWCEGKQCPTLAKKLTGNGGTLQFSFSIDKD